MTREEAIAIIENEKKCVNRANNNDYCNRDCYNCELVKTDTEILKALNMAIKALEQEHCENCISRQAVLEQINCWIGSGEYRYTNATDYLTRRMQDIPPVEPERKTGKWIPRNSFLLKYRCSECKQESEKYDYCPNCGVKMEKVN